jgi:hypothetical protein
LRKKRPSFLIIFKLPKEVSIWVPNHGGSRGGLKSNLSGYNPHMKKPIPLDQIAAFTLNRSGKEEMQGRGSVL